MAHSSLPCKNTKERKRKLKQRENPTPESSKLSISMQTYSHARTLAHGTLTAKHTKTHAYLRFDKLKMQDTLCKDNERRKGKKVMAKWNTSFTWRTQPNSQLPHVISFFSTFIMQAKLKPNTFNIHGWANLAMQARAMREDATAQNREDMDGEAVGKQERELV